MARKELFTDVFETDTFNEWRLKTNSIKINLQDMYDEIDAFPTIAVMLVGDQTVDGVKSYVQKSRWEQEYTENEVTPMLELRVTNSNSPRSSNSKGSGPSIDFYNPDTTASDPGVYDVGTATQDTWLASRIASVSESANDLISNSSLIFYTSKNVRPLTEKMRITSDGEVGIGTANPKGQLSVQTSNDNSIISIQSKDSRYAAVTFGDSQSHKSGQIQYHNAGNSMRFFTGEDSNITASSNERVRITSAGNVGIGLTNPGAKLDVGGDLRTSGYIEAFPNEGGIALTYNDGYGNANIAFNHTKAIPSKAGSSARITAEVDSITAAMSLELKDNVQANATQDTTRIIYLKTDLIDLYKQTRIRGQLNVDNKVGIGGVDYPDYALCVGGKSTEAGHVALNAQGGAISLRPLKNTTHRWLLNALDTNGGRFNITSGRWNAAKNTYDEIPVLSVMTNKQVRVPSTLSVGPSTGSSLPFVVSGEDAGISGQFAGTVWVNQFSGNTKAHAFLSTNDDSAMVGGNLRLNGSTEAKGTNLRGSSAIKFSQPNGTAGEILFLRAEDSDDGGYNVIESGRFDEAGRFGINVTNPTQSLDVDGNIKGSNKLLLMNNSYPQFVLSNADGQTKRFAIWNSKSIDRMELGPQNALGNGTTALSINRSSIVEIYKGGKLHLTKERIESIGDPQALVNKEYVDNKVETGGALTLNASTGYYEIPTLTVQSQNGTDQGGEIGLNRASDNSRYWNIDVFGSTATPSLRFSHENDDSNLSTEVVTITSNDRVGINENDPDYDLCIGGKSTEAGSVCIDADGGSIQLRPLKNTTHAWMFNAFDQPNGDAAIVSRIRSDSRPRGGFFGRGGSRSGYRSSSILTFSSTGTVTANAGNIVGKKGIQADSDIVAGGDVYTGNNVKFGKDFSQWILHSRQNNTVPGDFIELAARNNENTDWHWNNGFRQYKNGNVQIGGTTENIDTGYKLYVDGSILLKEGGDIIQRGKVTPEGWGGGLTTFDIYSDGGTIAVGKAGSKECYFNRDGLGFVKTRLTLGYTPKQATDAVPKSYVDAVIADVRAGASNFSGRTQYNFGGTQNSRTTSHADSLIPKTLVGHSTHGGGFVSKFTTTSSSDGGGIALEVSDNNNDEHAISAYNSNASVNKEIFHVRAATGDLYASGNIFNRGNIGTEGNISIGHNADDFYSIQRGFNNTNLSFIHHTKTKTKILLSFSESSGNVHLTQTGTAPTSLVTKAYVDTAVDSVKDLGRDFVGRTNFGGAQAGRSIRSTHIGSRIGDGAGHSHGGHFVAKFSSTSSDSGGIQLHVGDTNNDEHAISAYNTNTDKEIFHVRSATGDMFNSGKFYTLGNIGTEGKLHIGKTGDYHYISKHSSDGLQIGYTGGGKSRTGLRVKESGEVALGKSGTSAGDLVNKKYVDDRIAGVPAGDITSSGLTNALKGYWNSSNDGATSGLDADKLDGNHGSYYLNAGNLTGIINDARIPDIITPLTSVRTKEIRTSTNQELILNAGESSGKISGQTNEYVYVNAESGLSVNTPHPRNRNWQDGRSFETTVITGAGINIKGNKVWHGGNDGDKSGLDADLLDGNHANVFAKVNTKVAVSTPTSSNHATTKEYVDNKVSTAVNTIGGNYKIVSGASYVTSGFTNQVGSFNESKNYFDVYPPTGYTMSDLEAFLPSMHVIHFAGGVDRNDSIKCHHRLLSNRIRVFVQGTEQRAAPAANYIAVWRNS